MPLIDAYIKCTDIKGSYKATNKEGHAKLEATHEGWSEIYEFSYSLDEGYPTIEITKPMDNASNDLYVRYLQSRSRDLHKGKNAKDALIDEIKIELCRWVDINNDGIVDEFQVFLEYSFKNCRVLAYDTEVDFDADDLPEETIKFGFREMSMTYYHPEESSSFQWNFMSNQEKN